MVSSKNVSGIERKLCIQDLASPNIDEGHYIRRLDALFATFCQAFQSLRCCRSNLLDDFYCGVALSVFVLEKSCFSSGSFALHVPDGRSKGLCETTRCSGEPEALRGS